MTDITFRPDPDQLTLLDPQGFYVGHIREYEDDSGYPCWLLLLRFGGETLYYFASVDAAKHRALSEYLEVQEQQQRDEED